MSILLVEFVAKLLCFLTHMAENLHAMVVKRRIISDVSVFFTHLLVRLKSHEAVPCCCVSTKITYVYKDVKHKPQECDDAYRF